MEKKIIWESWNELEKESTENKEPEIIDMFDEDDNGLVIKPMFGIPDDNIVYTPFGDFPKKSKLKPTDRWQCWMGHTNFRIMKSDISKIVKNVDGIASMTLMDPYTFCIGIAKHFTLANVREQIERNICSNP